MSEGPSKSAVRKAGSTIRKYGRREVDEQALEAALEVVRDYRQTFSGPLVIVNNGLRKFCTRLDLEAEVTQRLKKTSTIESKLKDYESGLDLSRMQDIGGCRAVVKDISAVRALEARINHTWRDRICRVSDYIEHPRQSGYRSLHMVVEWDGRMIEVQIRTRIMHEWALTVEAFNGALGENYKQDGDHLVQRYLRAYSEMLHSQELDTSPSPELLDRFTKLMEEMREHLLSRTPRA